MNPGTTYPESLEREVRDCLSHMYDFAAMQDDPLVQRLAPHLTGLERIQVVRKMLIDMIEQLNDSVRHQSRPGRLYNILQLRYIEEEPTTVIVQQLALSERQYYRELNRAIEGFTQLLWDQITRNAPKADTAPTETISAQTEIERAYNESDFSTTDLQTLLLEAKGFVQSLAEQYDIFIDLIPENGVIITDTPVNILKQVLVYLLNTLIKRVSPGSHVYLYVDMADNHPAIKMELAEGQVESSLEQDEVLAYLLQKINATLIIPQDSPVLVELQLPQPFKEVLIIDDNPDVITLIERYLAHSSYSVVGVQDALEGIEVARKMQPFVIILDIMMPKSDGWEVLQKLKNHSETSHIPVLVCSVLDTPELALSLGASYYLRKPPGRVDLLAILAQISE
jgi:CheY-like chemotaxis protein